MRPGRTARRPGSTGLPQPPDQRGAPPAAGAARQVRRRLARLRRSSRSRSCERASAAARDRPRLARRRPRRCAASERPATADGAPSRGRTARCPCARRSRSSAGSGGLSEAPGNRRSVLPCAQIAPPSSLVAARRVATQCEVLGAGRLRRDGSHLGASGEGAIEGAREVVRTKDALTSGLNWRRGQFAALGEPRARATSLPAGSPPSWSRISARDVASVRPSVGAAPGSRAPLRLRADRVAAALDPSRRPRPALPRDPLDRGAARRLDVRAAASAVAAGDRSTRVDRALERRVLTRADAVVGVTRPIVEDVRERLGVDAG